MARTRNLKPGFFRNETLAELEFGARLLFAGLWTIADRDGRLEDRPRRIRAEVFPYDKLSDAKVHSWLSLLEKAQFIQRYRVNDGNYILITTWKKHQNPHVKEQASTIPAPDMPGACTVQEPDETGSSRAAFPSLRFTDSPSPAHLKLESRAARSLSGDLKFPEFWQQYPRKTGENSAARDWLSVVTPATTDAALACLGRYLASDEVRRGVVMNAGSTQRDVGWIIKCFRDNWKCEWPTGCAPSSRQQEAANEWSNA